MTSATAVGGVLVALVSMAHSVRWWLMLPVIPTAILFAAITAKREKSALGEIAVALVFSLVSVPICLAAGGATRAALAVGLAFSAIFVADTLAVRAIVLKTRGGGDPSAARATRVAVLAVTTVAAVGFVVTAWRGLLPWTTLVAATPGLVGAVWLTRRPPSTTRLRAVGWALVMTSAAAAIILIVGFTGAPLIRSGDLTTERVEHRQDTAAAADQSRHTSLAARVESGTRQRQASDTTLPTHRAMRTG